ncbi:MAG: class III cytochrome C family protein [Magnetococcales bacterium]|nr:class III cytochrome C family protein [Magnetococcales bacterium]
MSRIIRYFLVASLILITVLVFVYPRLMVAPGSVLKGHRGFETDCFACHVPFLGASSEKCVSCHKVERIGVSTTQGVPLAEKKNRVLFHQRLPGKNCVRCHGDHAGVLQYRQAGRFSHQLVDEVTRSRCVGCHQAPGDSLHRQSTETCAQCHGMETWRPARFKHDLLSAARRERCAACHQAKTPADALHRQASAPCGRCHTVTQWKPATFDHRKWFAFDKEHNVRCVSCHPNDNHNAYTCYGCHEHAVGKIRQEHLEEGIREFERCVLCHRNADKDEAEWRWKTGRWREGSPGSFPPARSGGRPVERPAKDSGHHEHGDDD